MRFEFKNRELSALYYQGKNLHRFPSGVIETFFEVMAMIEGAANENDIRALRSLRYEKLSGNRKGQISLRLNDQFRLIIQIDKKASEKEIWIIEIVDYH